MCRNLHFSAVIYLIECLTSDSQDFQPNIGGFGGDFFDFGGFLEAFERSLKRLWRFFVDNHVTLLQFGTVPVSSTKLVNFSFDFKK